MIQAQVSYLLDAGADVNAKELRGLNPLILAVSGKGNIEIVSMLLEKGADVNANDCHGFTALMSARWKKPQRNSANNKKVYE